MLHGQQRQPYGNFRFPCRIDAFVIGVGTEGETSVSLNLHEYRLKKNSIFIFSPKNILQVKSEEYFRANVIVVSPDFLRRINIDTKTCSSFSCNSQPTPA